MAFTEGEAEHIKAAAAAFVEQVRPPEHLRHKVDIVYRIHTQSVEIIEVRANMLKPGKIIEIQVAKTTYVRTQDCWKIFWRRANQTWNLYVPNAEVKSIEDFFAIVQADESFTAFGAKSAGRCTFSVISSAMRNPFKRRLRRDFSPKAARNDRW
jgi:hypothetical protein